MKLVFQSLLVGIFLSIFLQSQVFACEMCGCFMGITPYDNQSTIGVVYKYKSYSGYPGQSEPRSLFPDGSFRVGQPGTSIDHAGHTGISSNSTKDFEIYRSVEIRGKYFIHRRIELNAVLPYLMNSHRSGSTSMKISGTGDLNLFAGYHAIQRMDDHLIQQRLITGLGIKLETGSSTITNEESQRIHLMMQPGTGSTDYFTYLNYIAGYKNAGLSIYGMYKLNNSNSFGERIGNSISSQANIFYKIKKGNWILIPAIQTYFEHSGGEYISNLYQEGTKVQEIMSGAGLDVYFKNIGLNMLFQIPVSEETSQNELRSSCRIVLGLTYNFSQMSFLFGKDE